MPTPFPGMDPYLERRGLWEEVHTRLIVAIADELTDALRPNYRVAVERRTYLSVFAPDDFAGKPDVPVLASQDRPVRPADPVAVLDRAVPRVAELPMVEEVIERYLEVREVESGAVVTVIEILSHSNKSSKMGREQYERKRLQVLASLTNLVEIDLLRAGEPMTMRVAGNGDSGDYRIVVSRSSRRPQADLYLFSVRNAIPSIPIPLKPKEKEPLLPLNRILHELYDRAGYDLAVDYSRPPTPPLRPEDEAWAGELLAAFLTSDTSAAGGAGQ